MSRVLTIPALQEAARRIIPELQGVALTRSEVVEGRGGYVSAKTQLGAWEAALAAAERREAWCRRLDAWRGGRQQRDAAGAANRSGTQERAK